MDDIYKHPVFFECDSLREEKKKAIEKYFRIRRKSGGGESGSLRIVRDQVFSISFRYQKDQQRVLEKRKHVVEFADAPLVFTVRGSLDPNTSCPDTFSCPGTSSSSCPDTSSFLGQESTDPAQRIPASSPPPGGEEYELRPDIYLLSYLKECPEAGGELEEALTAVGCSAQIYPEEGRVVVKSLAPPAAVGEGRNWKAEVDKLFGAYLCHYEVDPHKVRALLQSRPSTQTTDEVKVYGEGGLAVVVGKSPQVNARLVDVEGSTAKCQDSRLSQKKTRVCRLGEAKLRLLWKDIEGGLGIHFPGVKVTQGDAGQVVLEGLVEDILGAGDWVAEKEKLVLERKVFEMKPHLLAVLRKAYGGPGMLGGYLGVGDLVEFELRDAALHFFSVSADKLDESENALQLEFKEVKVDVPHCSALSAELQKKLQSKTGKMNQVQYRAQAQFGSDSTVSLLGHTREVEELSEAVKQFILQSTVRLPFPELAQELPTFLKEWGFDFSGVTLHPVTSSSGAVMVLEGPTTQVTEVKKRLDALVDCLVQDRIHTDFFLSLRFSEGDAPVASYILSDGLQVLVRQGDITKLEADALVNAANEDLDHCGGVALALSKAGGPEIQRESKALVEHIGKIPTGDVVVTTGGNLLCKKLLHAVGPTAGRADGRERLLLEKAVDTALNLSDTMEFRSVALPCISSGVFGVPLAVCSEAIVSAVKRFGSQGGRSLSKIILIDAKEEAVRAMQGACDRLLQGSSGNSTPSSLEPLMGAAARDGAGPPGDVHVEVLQGTIEAQQVDAVVSPMVGNEPLSTRVGNALFKIGGCQLTAAFKREAGEEVLPGDAVVVEGTFGLPSRAVIFLSLAPWDGDNDGTAVEVLRMGINTILTSCERSRFGSVAFPVLGAGIALQFPNSVVARVLQEEVQAFKQNRTSRSPLLVRVAIHPDDTEASEVFKEVSEDFRQPDHTKPDIDCCSTKRVVLLGKTGSGKSNLANTIFGEDELFTTNDTANSGTVKCKTETRSVDGRSITLIDTPGVFDSNRPEEEVKAEIVSCITECAPGPHAFLIVLKVDKFTEQEQDVVNKIQQYFSEEALRYTVIVFTHGDQLPKKKKIEDFVSENKNLSDLVKKCGGRCHVFDNKYWKNKQQNNYRSNQLQTQNLLATINKMVIENNGRCYTNKVLQKVEEDIKKEEQQIRQSSGNLSQKEVREKAKAAVSNRILSQLSGIATGVLLGAFFGMAGLVGLVISAVKNADVVKLLKSAQTLPMLGAPAAAAAVGGAEVAAAATAVVVSTACFTAGGVMGGMIGSEAAQEARTPAEAAELAAKAIWEKAKATWNEAFQR